MRDPVEIGKALAGLVRRYVARELDGIARRLDALEARGAEKGEPGASVTLDDVRPLVERTAKDVDIVVVEWAKEARRG